MMNSIDNFDYVAYRDGTIDGEMLYIIQYMVAANNADKMLGGLVAGGGGVATGTIVTPEGYLVEVELSGGYAGVAENIGSMVAEGALAGVLAMNGQGGPNKGDSEAEKTVTNSAGQEVTRKYVKDQDELLKKAEEAAGGNLDDFTEIKPGWYQNKEGTIKIEWNPEGHANTNEGPHVTVRHKNEKGGWSVVEKYFIEGRDSY